MSGAGPEINPIVGFENDCTMVLTQSLCGIQSASVCKIISVLAVFIAVLRAHFFGAQPLGVFWIVSTVKLSILFSKEAKTFAVLSIERSLTIINFNSLFG